MYLAPAVAALQMKELVYNNKNILRTQEQRSSTHQMKGFEGIYQYHSITRYSEFLMCQFHLYLVGYSESQGKIHTSNNCTTVSSTLPNTEPTTATNIL